MIGRLALLVAAASSIGAAQPSYEAAHRVDPITVDGRLEEFTWRAASQVGPFTNIRGADALPTQAMLSWDSDALYVAFVAIDPRPWSKMYERDAELWNEEVVEVFLDPDGDGRDYAELEVSPHNVVVDLLIPAPGAKPASETARWDIEDLRTAVVKQGPGWTVEIAIPWSSLEAAGVSDAPRIGDSWRVGLYRIERPESGDPQLLAWAPTERNFHEPQRFGTVRFVLKP